MYRVRTSIDSENKAVLIANEVVASRAAVSVHIRQIRSIYQWDEEIHDEQEWEMESITSNPAEVERVIRGMHPYNTPEIIIDEIKASNEIETWITSWCKNT